MRGHEPTKEQNRLEIDRELLEEERQYFEKKVDQRAAAKVESLEAHLRVWKERYEESQKLQQNLEVNLRKAVDAAKKFGQRNPEEILAQLEDLRRQNNELDQKLAERPTEAAARRLEDLEAQKEQCEAERFRPIAKVQQLERSAATNRIAVLNLETLRDEKEQSFPDWQIPSDLLLESLGFFAETLDKLDKLSGNLWEKWVNTSPLVHDIGKTIRPQRLEELLERHIGHIEEICHRPRTYLKMETDRLPISRVQRISPPATEFLSAHTEDWEKQTFRNVRPKRVLCLIREDLLDIYENKVTARLIDHLLEYLQKLIIEVKALKRELEQADDFSKDTQKIH